MKLPSIDYVMSAAVRTIIRFPLTLLFALIGTVSVIMSIENIGDDMVRLKVILCASLGLTSSLSVALWATYYRVKKTLASIVNLALCALVIVYYLSLGERLTPLDGIRFFVLNVSLHLVVAFVLFVRNREVDEFWSFNKNLFIRIITSGIYSATLILGLNFAVLAIDNLFNVNVDERLYPEIAVSILGIFNTLFFLTGVPKHDELHLPLQYPKGLKNFTQFVLIPLVAIYLLILLAYEGKIVATFSLPKGWVSTLILVFSVLGILAMLLVYPLRNDDGNKWIKQLWRWYFWFLIPLLALLFWAILYRISLYGITVERYYVFILACWLTVITLYSILKPNYHIRFIPISLALVGFCSLYGPQSAGSVARYSQEHRLVELLAIHHKQPLTKEESKEVTSVVSYLYDNFSSKALMPFFPKAFPNDSSFKTASISSILSSENIKYTSRYGADFDEQVYLNASLKESFLQLPPADWFWYGSIYKDSKVNIDAANTNLKMVKIDLYQKKVVLSIHEEEVQLDLGAVITLAQQQLENYSLKDFILKGTSEHYEVVLIIKNLSGVFNKTEGETELNSIDGAFFVKNR